MTGKDVRCTTAMIVPCNFTEGDKYGLEDVLGMQMPNPLAEPGQVEYYQTVPVLSHEFLAMVSTTVTMSPWFSRRTAPGCQRRGVPLGPMDEAQEWHDAKLTWYKSFYERKPVTDFLKKSLTTSFTECPAAWNKVLEVKGTSSTDEARRSSVQPKPSGAPLKPLDTPIDD